MFKDSTISNNLTYSLQHYLDDMFLEDGALFDINNSSGQYGLLSTLQKINHPNYTNGTVWGSRRKNWIWEPEGIQISGVWVNNVLMRSGYRINYRDGYVLFDNPISSGTVRLNYSFKYIEVKNVIDANFPRFDLRSFRVDDSQYITGSGFPHPKDRTQLPAIAIEFVGNGRTKPYSIGPNKIKRYYHDVVIHVISEDGEINNKIRDKIQDLEENYFNIFDVENVKKSGVYPISRDGFLVNSSGTYEYMSDNYKFSKSYRSDSFFNKVVNEGCSSIDNSIYHGTLRITLETILGV